MKPTDPQPPPTRGNARQTWHLVVEDVEARAVSGLLKYGTEHRHDNGRDHLVDAYQEGLDLAVYMRAEIERRKLQWEAVAAALDALRATPESEPVRLAIATLEKLS